MPVWSTSSPELEQVWPTSDPPIKEKINELEKTIHNQVKNIQTRLDDTETWQERLVVLVRKPTVSVRAR